MDLHQLDVLINDAGTDTSGMETDVLALDQSDPKVVALRERIEAHGGKLAAIQAWSTGARVGGGGQSTGLPPGMVVVDVGGDDGVYTGPIDAAGLTPNNKAYIANHLGDFSNKWGQVFNGRVTFPAVMGDLANTPENPVTPDGFDLSAPLPSH